MSISRSAWEGASFFQRMNPGCMSSAPAIRMGGDPLDSYVEAHRYCPRCSRQLKPRGYERHLRACSISHWSRRRADAIPF